MVVLNPRVLLRRHIEATYFRFQLHNPKGGRVVELRSFDVGKVLFDMRLPRGYGLNPGVTSDGQQVFYTASPADWQQVVRLDWTDARKYSLARYNCTKFSWVFKAHAAEHFGLDCGWVKAKYHSWNIVIYPDLTWAWFEPQNDLWIPKQAVEEHTLTDGIYTLENGVVQF